MHDWHSPNWVKWRNSIIASLIVIDEPVVIIAEGFGALAAASVAEEYPGKIIAALLVDPADPDNFDIRKKIPKQSLPAPTRIISSSAADEAKNAYLALVWGADFAHTPNQLQSDMWPEAIAALQELVGKTFRNHEATLRIRHRMLSRNQLQRPTNFNTAIAF